ncbi:MAG: aminoacetone oxidase family FAD-binding enzyme [Eggerthellaceae bacterium]|nr:aminoacetone oxidase family FAD-binding enzyme [Eggerthellaceae bacterium]
MTCVGIIGGGASGLVAAIEAARQGAQVIIFEAGERIGAPILRTGNGRCNISNTEIFSSDYTHKAFVQQVFNELPPEEVYAFFSDAGLLTYVDDEGRIYPYSGRANTVVDILRMSAQEAGVEERVKHRVEKIVPTNGKWKLSFQDKQEALLCDVVVVATGSGIDKVSLPSDIELKHMRPVLGALKTDTTLIKGLDGLRVKARVYLDDDEQSLSDAWMDVISPHKDEAILLKEFYGEVLFRDYGISGIATMDISRFAHKGSMVFLDMIPDMTPQEKVDFIYNQAMDHPTRTATDILAGMLPHQVARAIVKAAGLDPDEPILAEQEAVVLAMVSESFGLEVHGIANPKQAQVRRGGVKVGEVSPQTLESSKHPGLFITGEALDVDGRCGGFNLHWAWTTGILAGRSAAVEVFSAHEPVRKSLEASEK